MSYYINTAFSLSYPEDASKINTKYVGFFNQISEMKQKWRKRLSSKMNFQLFLNYFYEKIQLVFFKMISFFYSKIF